MLVCPAKDAAERYSDVASLERALAACACAANWDQDPAARWWRNHGRAPAARATAG